MQRETMRAFWTAGTASLLVLLMPLAGGTTEPTFPWDYRLEILSPSLATTYHNETIVAYSDSPGMRADLEDFELVAATYKVRVILKPPGCTGPEHWHDGGWTLPDPLDILAPLDWDAACDPAGLWTIEVYGEAAPLALGNLRVHVSELPAS